MYQKNHTILFIIFITVAIIFSAVALWQGYTLTIRMEEKEQQKQKEQQEQQEQKKQKAILEAAEEVAWPEGTDKELWEYKTGDFKDPKTRELFDEIGYTADAQYDYTVCGHFVDLVVYRALDVRTCLLPDNVDEDYAQLPKELEVVHEGKIKDFSLKPGDIIRYKKIKASNGHHSEHALVYCGGADDLVAESGICIRYPVIQSARLTSGILKWDSDEVLVDTLQVIRPR